MPVRSAHRAGQGNSGTDWRLRTQRRRPQSMLNGAAQLAKVDNDIEEPTETTRTVETDGRKVTFELMKNVTKRPTTKRKDRMASNWTNINVHKSSFLGRVGHRTQRWLTTKDVSPPQDIRCHFSLLEQENLTTSRFIFFASSANFPDGPLPFHVSWTEY